MARTNPETVADIEKLLFKAELGKLRILKQEMVNRVQVKVNNILVMVNKKTVMYTKDFFEHYKNFNTIASVKEDMRVNDAHKTEVVWECSCPELPLAVGFSDGTKFNFVFPQDHDDYFDVGFRIRKIDIDHQELKELLTRKLVHPNIYEEDQQEEEFEANHDYIPGFLEALGELAYLSDDFHATFLRRAIIALEGQIITAVEDIKLFKLIELKGVGKSTLAMLEEFINDGKIEKLEEMRPQIERENASVKFLMGMFKDMTEHECEAMYDHWVETGRLTCEPESSLRIPPRLVGRRR